MSWAAFLGVAMHEPFSHIEILSNADEDWIIWLCYDVRTGITNWLYTDYWGYNPSKE